MKKRILIDARMVGPIMHGIAQYVLDILGGIHRYFPPTSRKYELEVLIDPKEFPAPWLESIPWKVYRSKVTFLSKAELFQLPKEILASQATFFHTPSFSSLWKYPRPHLQTLHDLNHLHYGGVAKKIYYQNLVKRSALNAVSLMTVSDSSRKEIQDWLPSEKKIEVVDNAIHLETPGELHPKLSELNIKPSAYFLCVSNSKTHKNLGTLCRAYASYRKKSKSPLPLILTSKEPSLQAKGIFQIGGVESHQVSSLMKNARTFFFPSYYEGFGRPPVEAFCLGTPVVASDIPPHRESLGSFSNQGVKLISPDHEDEWTSEMIEAERGIKKPDTYDSHKLLERYSLKALAQKIHRIYDGI